MENSTGNADKKSMKTCQNDKTKERCPNIKKKKKGQHKNNNTTYGNKQESTGEIRKVKEIST